MRLNDKVLSNFVFSDCAMSFFREAKDRRSGLIRALVTSKSWWLALQRTDREYRLEFGHSSGIRTKQGAPSALPEVSLKARVLSWSMGFEVLMPPHFRGPASL